MQMYTDPTRIHATDIGHVENNPVFIYHDAFNPNKREVEILKEKYKKGTVGDVEVKKKLAEVLNNFLDPIRKRRLEYQKDTNYIKKILLDGTEKARVIASQTLKEVRRVMKINYF